MSATVSPVTPLSSSFFFNDTATTEIYTLSLHDALPISHAEQRHERRFGERRVFAGRLAELVGRRRGIEDVVVDLEGEADVRPVPAQRLAAPRRRSGGEPADRSEEHTSELQSLAYLVCRLLLEKKKK